MADLGGVRAEVAAFADALTVLAARVAAVEAALGLPRAPDEAPEPLPPPEADGGNASAADVARLETALTAFADARAALERRVATLEDALAAFAPQVRRARGAAAAPPTVPDAGGSSRADLDRIQKQTIGCAGTLAGLELRVAAAEDALDAFFGTVR